ncbi:MAG: 1-deoxy-D-xylulose-5-phosphate reductoisomerase [Firmicutes bacterium]|nr:1-deoxy-D-xylulose-5-phosphate reductoisomerase [Bacillota bacterium]
MVNYTIGVSVIGCGGSVGRQTLDVIEANPDRFSLISATVNRDVRRLAETAARFSPRYTGAVSVDGPEANFTALNTPGVDVAVVAMTGSYGFSVALEAVRKVKRVALANKESLVLGGELLMSEAKRCGTELIPVDSEHSAVFQCLMGQDISRLNKIILTASGGPFFGYTADMLEDVTPEAAVKHPTWKMGPKISVDSATMMNKGLELSEAGYFFDTRRLSYIVHPESIVHSMVEMADGSVLMQAAPTSMEIPIAFALSYPDRVAYRSSLDLAAVGKLTFYKPDEENFPFPRLAVRALEAGGCYPAALCVADDAAVSLFLDRKIKFSDIYRICERIVTKGDYNINVNEKSIEYVVKEVTALVNSDYRKLIRSC